MRKILHIDLNNFYASVECLKNPKLKNFPVVVCGDAKKRHGIVLAKNMIAKKLGIKTGMVIWEAQGLAPKLKILTANFKLYMEYSQKVKSVFKKYTDYMESFGIDESWLDLTKSEKLFGSYLEIADKIKNEIKTQIGLTVSIGASYNKIFAKLGSDIAGTDEMVEITKQNYKQTVWKLPVENLLYVGNATKSKFNKLNIFTIGDLAQTDVKILKRKIGKWGEYLHTFANGEDESEVKNIQEKIAYKSVGNSLTCYKDLNNLAEVETLLVLLIESVWQRCFELGIIGINKIHLGVKNSLLESFDYGKTCDNYLYSANQIQDKMFELFQRNYSWENAVRALSVSVGGFIFNSSQVEFFSTCHKEAKLEKAVYKIRNKYGNLSIKKAILLKDSKLAEIDIKDEHVIHPENFFKK